MQVILSCHSYRLFRMARNGSTEKEKGTHIANTEVPCGISCIVVVGGRFFLEGFYWEGPTNYSPPALKKKKKNWRSARAHSLRSFGLDQSAVTQRAEATVDECFLVSCVWARFPDRFPHYA